MKLPSEKNRFELVVCSTVVFALLAFPACDEASDSSASASIESCFGLRALLGTDEPMPGRRYVGANGFEFASLAGVTLSQADVEQCESLESSALALVTSGAPGASLAYRTSRFQVRMARGLADTAAGVPLRPDALLRVASVAKPYLGALAALLATEGRLDLDNTDGAHTLADYLPQTVGRIEYADRITVRQLLNHTSGVPDYFGEAIGPAWITHVLDSHRRGRGVTEDEALELVYGTPADFEPGTAGNYSNTGYLLAARVLDRVLGHSYTEAIHDRFLAPLALDETYFEKHDAFDLTRLSHGYRDASELGQSFSDWFEVDQGYGFANGGVVARVDQVAAFFRAVPGGRALPQGIRSEPFLAALRPSDSPGYGSGIQRSDDCYFHGGTFAGYSSVAFHCVARDVTGALFINSSVPEHEAALTVLSEDLMR
ncbi:MAG TPA: serine hydrolase domain-containing protein [Polyangiaceae bacterium]|nr:serine hydrolase domain-containing protein [Polyangiaceae bacterium]